MPITIAGSGTITGISAGGLPDGSITSDELAAGAVTAAKLAAGVGGKILQVVSATKTDTISGTNKISDNSWASALSATITPSLSTSKILVVGFVSFGTDDPAEGGDVAAGMRLVRDSTAICVGNAAGNRRQGTTGVAWSGREDMTLAFPFSHLDSPATTSATTYYVQMGVRGAGSGTWYVNRNHADGDGNENQRTASTITLLEVAG